ncbi:MAG: hypothetical protein GY913_15290 [Proteobacteria bacterium]|nr:hypothetical protein [Pseudomonadota bacterium]
MASRATEELQGLLVPDPRISADTYDATLSTVTQAGSRPGTPAAADDLSTWSPVVESEQGDDLVIVATDADALTYRLGTDSSGDERGWDTPSLMTGFGAVQYTAVTNYAYHDCVTLPDGRVLEMHVNAAGTTPVVSIFDPSDRSVSTVTTSGLSATGSQDHLALGIRADGRVFAALNGVIWSADSADGYAAWTLRSRTPYTGASPAGQRAMAWSPRGWLMLISNTGTDYEQWASTDGVMWAQVEDVASAGDTFDVAAYPDGSFLVTRQEDTSEDLEAAHLGSPWDKLSEATQVTVRAGTTRGSCAAVYPDGTAYAYHVLTSDGSVSVHRSTDMGATWAAFAQDALEFGSGQVYPVNLRATVVESTVYLQSQHVSNTNSNTALWWHVFGGWSQVTVGGANRVETSRGGYGSDTRRSYVPFEEPDTSGVWAKATTGAPVVSITGGIFRTTCGATSTVDYTRATLGASTSQDVQWALASYNGPTNAAGTSGAFVRLTAADLVDDYDVEVQIGDADYVVWDLNGAASLGTVAVDTTGGLEWRFYCDDGAVSVWHRTIGSSTWTTGVDAVAATSNVATPAASSQLQWGARISTTAADWQWLQGSKLLDDLYQTGTDAIGRALSAPGLGVGIPDAGTTAGPARLAGVGGTPANGQTWDVDRHYDHPLSAVYPQVAPSPAAFLRTTDKTEVILAWDLGDASVGSTVLGRAIGMYLDSRGTFRTAYLESSATGAAWTTELTWDAATGWAAMNYALAGDILSPIVASGNTGTYYVQRRGPVGGYVLFAADARTIVDTDSGVWTSGAETSTIKPRFRLDGIDGTEAGTTCAIVWPRAWVVGHPSASPTAARYWRLRIPASQVTPYDYYEIGALAIGEVVPFGLQTAWGWSEQVAPAFTERRSRRGSTLRRKTGPIVRTWTMPWDPMQWWINTTDPDFVAASVTNALPLAAVGEVFAGLRGILDELESGAVPVLALRSIPGADDTCTVSPDQFLWGFLSGDLRLTQVSGDDDTSGQQIVRCEQLTVEESV